MIKNYRRRILRKRFFWVLVYFCLHVWEFLLMVMKLEFCKKLKIVKLKQVKL